MKCIFSHSNDPYFNLAAEEYLLKNFEEDFYFQYVNMDSVVIGKHQNALAEINLDYLDENNIRLARRISGGGSVYHDKGNVNYSFITTEKAGDFIKFKTYTAPIILALKELGLEANMGKRNEILLSNFKISGTASHVFKNRVLHHGTLLYSADLEKLGNCLYELSEAYIDKAVKSVRSNVINIQDQLARKLSESEFYQFLFSFILGSGYENVIYTFSNLDKAAIDKMIADKFERWEWNFGYSPKYVVEKSASINATKAFFKVSINKGLISEVEIECKESKIELAKLHGILKGLRHEKYTVQKRLHEENFASREINEILQGLF